MSIPPPASVHVEGVELVDCHYLTEEHVASFLMVNGSEAAFVDNGAQSALPHLLEALEPHGLMPEDVRYVIVTHVHLDHAGATAALMEACPNATLLAHPKAAKHLINPERLIAASKQVYGEAFFHEVFGEIYPISEARVQVMSDGERMDWNGRGLTFYHTLGHCSHHCVIHDSETNGVFTGDQLGICHQRLQNGERPCVFAAATPTEFDPALYREGVERIAACNAEYVFVSHYGIFGSRPGFRVPGHIESSLRNLAAFEAILTDAAASPETGNALKEYVRVRVHEAITEHLEWAGLSVDESTQPFIEHDVRLDTEGVTYAAERRKRAASSTNPH